MPPRREKKLSCFSMTPSLLAAKKTSLSAWVTLRPRLGHSAVPAIVGIWWRWNMLVCQAVQRTKPTRISRPMEIQLLRGLAACPMPSFGGSTRPLRSLRSLRLRGSGRTRSAFSSSFRSWSCRTCTERRHPLPLAATGHRRPPKGNGNRVWGHLTRSWEHVLSLQGRKTRMAGKTKGSRDNMRLQILVLVQAKQ